jgi:hypothetical protein
VLQAVPKAVADLPNVPVAIELAKTDEARRLIQAGIHDTAAITRPYALPPGTPKDRVQMLRKAFRETMNDKDFLAEASKSKLDVDPVSGEEVEKIVAGLFKLDSATVAKMSEIPQVSIHRQRKRSVCLSWISTGILSGQILELDFDADSGGARLVMRQSGDSHEADSLVAILFEQRDLFRTGTAGYFPGYERAQVFYVVPPKRASGDRLHEIALLIVNALLAQRCHDNVRASKHVVVELAPRTTDQSFLQKLLVAADDGRDMLPYF